MIMIVIIITFRSSSSHSQLSTFHMKKMVFLLFLFLRGLLMHITHNSLHLSTNMHTHIHTTTLGSPISFLLSAKPFKLNWPILDEIQSTQTL